MPVELKPPRKVAGLTLDKAQHRGRHVHQVAGTARRVGEAASEYRTWLHNHDLERNMRAKQSHRDQRAAHAASNDDHRSSR